MERIKALGDKKPNWLIVDHYGLDSVWGEKIRPHVEKIMVIDDLANRNHHCDLLLDQNWFEDKDNRYLGLVPPFCKMLTEIIIQYFLVLLDPFFRKYHNC